MYTPRAKTTITLAALVLVANVLAGCASDNPHPDAGHREDSETFELAPGESMEYKLRITEDEELDYSWSASRAVSFDFHGDTGGSSYTSHKKGTATNEQDTWTAPFTGNHGWWWQNNNRASVTITLDTEGTYAIIGVV